MVVSSASWDVLDFHDAGNDLAKRLTNDDVGAALCCVDAKANVRDLRLTGCVNLTGVGLEPLRGSAIIESIDLRLIIARLIRQAARWNKSLSRGVGLLAVTGSVPKKSNIFLKASTSTSKIED
ncbi:hypothetical protein ACHAWF_002841 [Thalassiosira exigua]